MINISIIPNRLEPLHVLMCTPDHFKIVDVKNVHMKGNAGKVNSKKFHKQWLSIFNIYKREADTGNIDGVRSMQGVVGCEDMVFCANQSFPWVDEVGHPLVILSRMKYPSRQQEVPYFESYYHNLGYQLLKPPGKGLLEGMGDLIPMPGKRLVFGGYGHRTDLTTLTLISQLISAPVISLELISDEFYHLDTCFIPLNEHCVLIAREAFTELGLKTINSFFSEVIEIPYQESAKGFALNAHIVHGNKYSFAIIQKGNPYTIKILEEKGFKVHTVNTSEFMKSGGSVFCMKMMHY